MTYQAPVADMAFALKHAAGFGQALADGVYGDLGEDLVDAVLEQAGKFATDVLAPLNASGDRHGTPFKDGAVTMPPGWREAYQAWAQAGWNGLAAPAQWGEHDLTENIIHFVLARLPDAPPGTKGISLFLVPKFLLNGDGSLGRRNDARAHSIEHKLGIHASPTCTMVYGDAGGATGFLIGEENCGMVCMFTMMNQARLSVALQGVAIAERATQQALAYARERKQGRAPSTESGASPIIAHPDVKRMLLTMRALTRAARALSYATAVALDRAQRGPDEAARRSAHERASLLTPVAKAFSTDIGNEVASLGVQVHGGMGYIEETGAAQYYRDGRIAAIYEGTNGIQAIDLVTRKLPLAGGATVKAYIGEIKRTVEAVNASNDPAFGWTGVRLQDATEALERATHWLLGSQRNDLAAALAGATPYLRLFALAAGGALLAEEALAAVRLGGNGADAGGRIALARFFAENLAVGAESLERTG